MPEEKFTGDMLIVETLEMNEGAAGVLEAFGLPCHRCAVADVETIAEGARAKGVDLERLLLALNSLVKPEPATEDTPSENEGPNRSSQDEG